MMLLQTPQAQQLNDCWPVGGAEAGIRGSAEVGDVAGHEFESRGGECTEVRIESC
jgi:hypothetical protein